MKNPALSVSSVPTFKVGDYVQSAPNSSDITSMGLRWKACVMSVRRLRNSDVKTPDGHVYETAGYYEVVDPAKTKGWFKAETKPTLRQLWSNHLLTLPENEATIRQ